MSIPFFITATAAAVVRRRKLEEGDTEIPYFPKSEYTRQREYEEFKKLQRIEEEKIERKNREKHQKIKTKKLKKINKQVSKNGFNVSNFRSLYDHCEKQTLTGKKLKTIEKIFDEMKKHRIYTFDLEIFIEERNCIEQKFELDINSKVDDSFTPKINLTNDKSKTNDLLQQLKTLREIFPNDSSNNEYEFSFKKIKIK